MAAELMPILRRGGLLICAVAAAAAAFAAVHLTTGADVTVTDPRPLARVAEILTRRYGVPVSYEDVSAYAYDGDLSGARLEMRGLPGAGILPRATSLKSFAEPLNISFDPVSTADPAGVAKMLRAILAQHEAADNPGRFKVIETAAGLAIVPSAVRDHSGTIVPDQSPLDLRISFGALGGDSTSPLWAFRDALKAVSGREISVEGIWGAESGPIRANNEVARDVLVRILNGFDHFGGPVTAPGDVFPTPRLVWILTTDAAVEPPHAPRYHLDFRKVIMEEGYPSSDGKSRREVTINR